MKAVRGCPGYFVSRDGKVWSTHRHGRWGRDGLHEIGATAVASNGYRTVRIKRANGKYWTQTVHALVVDAFIGPKPAGSRRYEIRHKNGREVDCRASNLRWGTISDNQQDALRHGTRPVGSRNNLARLNECKVATAIRLIVSGATDISIARRLGVTKSTILAVRQCRTWRHVRRPLGFYVFKRKYKKRAT